MTWSDAARRAAAEARRRKGLNTKKARSSAEIAKRGNKASTYKGTPASPYNAAGEYVPYNRRKR